MTEAPEPARVVFIGTGFHLTQGQAHQSTELSLGLTRTGHANTGDRHTTELVRVTSERVEKDEQK